MMWKRISLPGWLAGTYAAAMPVRAETVRPAGSSAVEDYLEQIHRLIEEKGYARVVDIAANLGISQASVTNMIQKLDANGLVVYEKYRGMVLTPEGERIGKEIRHRHAILTRLLEHFGLDASTIYADVEGMEHHISKPTLRALEILTESLEEEPALMLRIRRRLASASKRPPQISAGK
jgi:Mn-dependent DtxR family transcriptional regulator